MSVTAFGTNDPRTQKKWSQAAFEYALKNMWLSTKGFLGTTQNPNAIIQVDKNLVKGVGDKIVFELYAPLTGTGFGDDGTAVGNSEKMTVMNFPVSIHERGHSIQVAGPMSQQRTATDIRSRGKQLLGTWFQQILENDLLSALCGLYNEINPTTGAAAASDDTGSSIQTVNEATPSSNRIYRGGQSYDGATFAMSYTTTALLTAATVTNCLFGTKVISFLKRAAKMATPKIRPVQIDGGEYYVMLAHPYQIKALRAESAWLQAQREANIRGKSNPIFSGAEGIWDGVVVHEYERLPMRTGAGSTALTEGFTLNTAKTATNDACANTVSAARGLFLGAQAGVLGWGKMPSWYEDKQDGGRKPVVITNSIYGAAKTRFNAWDDDAQTNTAQEDFGVIVAETCVVVD